MRKDERLRRSERLLERTEFRRVYDHGQKKNLPLFTVFVLKTDLERSRLGITVTRQIGGSVVRNRCKRLVREAVRRNKEVVPGSFDLVINVKRAMADADYAVVEVQLKRFLSELSL